MTDDLQCEPDESRMCVHCKNLVIGPQQCSHKKRLLAQKGERVESGPLRTNPIPTGFRPRPCCGGG